MDSFWTLLVTVQLWWLEFEQSSGTMKPRNSDTAREKTLIYGANHDNFGLPPIEFPSCEGEINYCDYANAILTFLSNATKL